jgi:hypothetical protein
LHVAQPSAPVRAVTELRRTSVAMKAGRTPATAAVSQLATCERQAVRHGTEAKGHDRRALQTAHSGTVVGGAEMRVLSREQVSGPAQRPGPGLLGVGTAAVSAPLRSREASAQHVRHLQIDRCERHASAAKSVAFLG